MSEPNSVVITTVGIWVAVALIVLVIGLPISIMIVKAAEIIGGL